VVVVFFRVRVLHIEVGIILSAFKTVVGQVSPLTVGDSPDPPTSFLHGQVCSAPQSRLALGSISPTPDVPVSPSRLGRGFIMWLSYCPSKL